jgi:predicted metal-dependent hydrolase
MSGSGVCGDRWSGVMGDSRYVAFVAHFNGDRDYYECHECMEELWLEEGRHPLLQGLLQAAVGLHHWNNGNLSGAVKLMRQALHKLAGQPDTVLGLDLSALRADLKRSLEVLMEQPEKPLFIPFHLRVVNPQLERLVTLNITANR